MITEIEQKIQDYQEGIRRGEYPKIGECCSNCRQEVEFKLHDHRQRKLRIIANALVQVIIICLIRWRCPICKKKYTRYPDFMCPHKRYAVEHIVEISDSYLAQEISYEDALREDNARIGYPEEIKFVNMKKPDNEESDIGESFLASSTLWRWCSWLGGLEKKVSEALKIINEQCPNRMLHREVKPVYRSKYRSVNRKEILQTASRVLQMREEKIGKRVFFPNFAIGI